MGTAHPYKRSGNIAAIDGSEQIVNLPLGELELLPCFRLAVLLALNHPVIPGEQPLLLEDRVDIFVQIIQSPCKSQLDRAGLAGCTATPYRNLDVVVKIGRAHV